MSAAVYLLWHEHDDESETSKLLGVYSSREAAQSRIESAKALPGFRLYPADFVIAKYEIDRDEWTEGFAITDPDRWGVNGEMAWVDDPDPK